MNSVHDQIITDYVAIKKAYVESCAQGLMTDDQYMRLSADLLQRMAGELCDGDWSLLSESEVTLIDASLERETGAFL